MLFEFAYTYCRQGQQHSLLATAATAVRTTAATRHRGSGVWPGASRHYQAWRKPRNRAPYGVTGMWSEVPISKQHTRLLANGIRQWRCGLVKVTAAKDREAALGQRIPALIGVGESTR